MFWIIPLVLLTMASQTSVHKGKNNFSPSIYTLGLDKLLDCMSEANGNASESQNYIIQREKVTIFAENLVSEMKSYKETIKKRDTEISHLTKQVIYNIKKLILMHIQFIAYNIVILVNFCYS